MKINVYKLLLIALLMHFLIVGCTRNDSLAGTQSTHISSAINEAAQAKLTFKGLGIRYAQNFKIDYLNDSVKLIADSDGNKLLLVPKGIMIPPGYDDAVLVETPIANVMYNSTTYVGLLGALENDSLFESVAIVTTAENEWTIPQILNGFRNGTTHFIQHGMTGIGNIEEIIKMKPTFVFTGGMDAIEMQLRNLLDEIGIKHATILEYTEEGDSAYLEWIKFFAAFYNLDEEADRIFEEKMSHLNEFYAKTAQVANRPTVAYGQISNGMIYTQSGTSTLSKQIEKAGGIYALNGLEGNGTVIISMEEFFNKCRNADIIIYGSTPKYCPDKAFLLETDPLIGEFAAFKNDAIYIFDQGYYMNSGKVVEKFEDLVSIIQPDLLPGHSLIMYQKLPDKS